MMTATYRYRVTSTGGSSAKYGPCEVCGQHATEVFQQAEEQRYADGWTQDGCRRLFGHESCLVGQQHKQETPQRMKWVQDGYTQRSSCGRFVVSRVCMNPKWSGYWGLTDTATGREYPCRTEASAKTAARNLKTAAA